MAIDNPWSDEIRRRAQEAYGLPPEQLMVHITQNHAAPSIGNHFCRDSCNLFPAGHQWLRGGDERYNERLSTKRAEAVRDYLLNNMVLDAAKVEAVGYGESRPIATNDTEEGRAQNRRIDVTLTIE